MGVKNVHLITPNECEHLTALSHINATSDCILNYYIFKGKRYQNVYITEFEEGARMAPRMAMQENAWMIGYLFEKWLNHFVKNL